MERIPWDTQRRVTPHSVVFYQVWSCLPSNYACSQVRSYSVSLCLFTSSRLLTKFPIKLVFWTGNILNPMIVYQLQRYLVYCLPVSQIMVFTSTKLKRYLQVCLPVMKLLATCQNHSCLSGKTDKISLWLFISYGVACHVQKSFF